MFDKNDFKEKFRSWSELNPEATIHDAKLICDMLIPFEYKESYSWLEEQTLAWFTWKYEMKNKMHLVLNKNNNNFEEIEEIEERNLM